MIVNPKPSKCLPASLWVIISSTNLSIKIDVHMCELVKNTVPSNLCDDWKRGELNCETLFLSHFMVVVSANKTWNFLLASTLTSFYINTFVQKIFLPIFSSNLAVTLPILRDSKGEVLVSNFRLVVTSPIFLRRRKKGLLRSLCQN